MINENDLEENIENNKNDICNIDSNELIRKTANDLTDAIARAQTKEELEELYQKFNLNNTKKNALRITQLNDLLDQVNKQASDRFTKRPDEISNKEILDYMTAIQNQIERSQRTVDGIRDLTAVQFNSTQNNTVNIHVGNTEIPHLSKDSRDRITDLVASILKESNQINGHQENIIDLTENKIEDENSINTDDDNFYGDE